MPYPYQQKRKGFADYFLTGLTGLFEGLRRKNLMEMQQKALAKERGFESEQNILRLFGDPDFLKYQSPEGFADISGYLQQRGIPGELTAPQETPEAPGTLFEPTERMRKYGIVNPLPPKEYIDALNTILDFEKPTSATARKQEPKEKSPDLQLVEDELKFINGQISKMATSGYDFSKEIEDLRARKMLLQRARIKLQNGQQLTDEERQALFYSRQNPQPGSPLANKQATIMEVARMLTEGMGGNAGQVQQAPRPQQAGAEDPLGIRK